jgi:ectoine hydroxylase
MLDREEILMVKIKDIPRQPTIFLTQDQRELYYEQGYLAFPALIAHNELTELRGLVDSIVDSTRSVAESGNEVDLEKGHTAENPRLRRVTYVDDKDPYFWRLCSDSVIPDIAADLLGPDVRFRDMMLNFKWADGGAEVKWHQDICFYPHTHLGSLQFLVFLEEVCSEQGPLQVIPASHKGPIFEHYDESNEWTGAIGPADLATAGVDAATELTGPAGTVSVHHCCTIHGSSCNNSASGRPAFVMTYTAADAMPYTAPPYPSSHYRVLVRGNEPLYSRHEEVRIPLPPDWSDGYTSIFEHQEDNS